MDKNHTEEDVFLYFKYKLISLDKEGSKANQSSSSSTSSESSNVFSRLSSRLLSQSSTSSENSNVSSRLLTLQDRATESAQVRVVLSSVDHNLQSGIIESIAKSNYPKHFQYLNFVRHGKIQVMLPLDSSSWDTPKTFELNITDLSENYLNEIEEAKFNISNATNLNDLTDKINKFEILKEQIESSLHNILTAQAPLASVLQNKVENLRWAIKAAIKNCGSAGALVDKYLTDNPDLTKNNIFQRLKPKNQNSGLLELLWDHREENKVALRKPTGSNRDAIIKNTNTNEVEIKELFRYDSGFIPNIEQIKIMCDNGVINKFLNLNTDFISSYPKDILQEKLGPNFYGLILASSNSAYFINWLRQCYHDYLSGKDNIYIEFNTYYNNNIDKFNIDKNIKTEISNFQKTLDLIQNTQNAEEAPNNRIKKPSKKKSKNVAEAKKAYEEIIDVLEEKKPNITISNDSFRQLHKYKIIEIPQFQKALNQFCFSNNIYSIGAIVSASNPNNIYFKSMMHRPLDIDSFVADWIYIKNTKIQQEEQKIQDLSGFYKYMETEENKEEFIQTIEAMQSVKPHSIEDINKNKADLKKLTSLVEAMVNTEESKSDAVASPASNNRLERAQSQAQSQEPLVLDDAKINSRIKAFKALAHLCVAKKGEAHVVFVQNNDSIQDFLTKRNYFLNFIKGRAGDKIFSQIHSIVNIYEPMKDPAVLALCSNVHEQENPELSAQRGNVTKNIKEVLFDENNKCTLFAENNYLAEENNKIFLELIFINDELLETFKTGGNETNKLAFLKDKYPERFKANFSDSANAETRKSSQNFPKTPAAQIINPTYHLKSEMPGPNGVSAPALPPKPKPKR